jgi:hypothetical protein
VTDQTKLQTAERAMQMICAVMNNNLKRDWAKLADIDTVVEAWVFHPERLAPDVTIRALRHAATRDPRPRTP